MQTVPTRTLAMALFAAISLASCNSVPTIISFTATPSNLPAGGGVVTLAWNVTGASILSIDQGVGIVTPLTVGSKVVLVGVTTTFTLTATDSAGNVTATATVTVAVAAANETVNGTVVDLNGQPVSGETVLITAPAFSQTTVTDVNGAFNIPNVPTPYDATLIDSTEGVEYQGLTRADPSLTAFLFLTNNRSATLSGSFVGGTFPETSGYSTQFVFASPQTSQNMGDPASGSYSTLVGWPGPATTTGTLYALQIHSVSGLPVSYAGYGTLSGVALQDTGTVTAQNVSLSPVVSGSLTGTVTAPSQYILSSNSVALEVTSNTTLNVLTDNSPGPTFSYVTPVIANTTLLVSASATLPTGEFSTVLKAGQSANGSGIALNIPAAPSLTEPLNAVTGVTSGDAGTQFSWTAFPGGVYELQASSSTEGQGPTFYVFTSATTATLPDLSAFGEPLPASTQYTWGVVGFAPVASIDLLAAAGGINFLTLDLSVGVSATQTFTPAP